RLRGRPDAGADAAGAAHAGRHASRLRIDREDEPPMHVAALYDIHNNLPALDAVLEDVRHNDMDLIVVSGDVVPGPMFHEALDRLMSVDVPTEFIQGNCEVAALAVL